MQSNQLMGKKVRLFFKHLIHPRAGSVLPFNLYTCVLGLLGPAGLFLIR